MTANTTSKPTIDGMITFSGLKLVAAAAGGGIVGPCTGTVTGARRGGATAGGGGCCRVRTIVTSSSSVIAVVSPVLTGGCAGTGANCAVPDAIVKSSTNSATF